MSTRRMIRAMVIALCLLGVFSFYLHAESGIYDRIGIISEHGLHGAVPEENIDLFTGNLTLKNLDIHLPGPNGFDLNIWRVYNSKILKDRLLGSAWGIQQEPYSWVGLGWSMHMGRLHSINTETPVIEYPDGRWETAYRNVNDGGVTFLTRDFAKLDKSAWKLYFKDGTIWTFGAQANVKYTNMVTEQVRVVTQITNSYGHKINITYDAVDSPRLRTVSDSMGRKITFISDFASNKLERIDVKNATGGVASYYYTVDEFNGDFYKLTSFDPPMLPAVKYEYGNGLASNWELLAVDTSYGGRMEYEYADQTFYYQVKVLETKVIHEKRIRFSSGSPFKTWTYLYPSYSNNAPTGTVTVTGPDVTTYATYNAYTPTSSWKTGLINQKYVSDGSSSEQYEWTSKIIHDVNQWYVLAIPMGYPAAPLQSKITRTISGDADTIEEYLYERSATKKYGLPTRVNLYANGNLKNYRDLVYYFEGQETFETKYMLNLLQSEEISNGSGTKLKETRFTYYTNGAINSIQKWRNGSSYLTWDYGYSSSNPNSITITIDQPGAGGTETMIYKYGVLATLSHPTYTEFTRTISEYDSSIKLETNQHEATMGFIYDNLGRITSINMPSDFNDISVSWSTNNVTITQGGNKIIKYWDGMGRDTGYKEQGDNVTLYYTKSLDSEGRAIAESKGSTAITDTYDYIYNAAGQVKQITDPRGKITTITLGADQRTVKDANNHSSIFEYAGLPGLVTRLTDPSPTPKIATYSYDGLGRLLSTVFNSNRTQAYSYNGLDQAVTESHPETGSITYTYSTANNLDTKTWGSTSTVYTYNTSNQLRTENAGDETITYAYDTQGRVSSISSIVPSGLSWSKASITYNSLGAITKEILTIPGLSAKTISYDYDLNNQLKEITYPDGKKTDYTNNGLNIPETIGFNGSTLVNAITYGIGKQPKLINISANGTSYTAAYNSNGNLTTAQLKKGSTFLYDADYTYDGVGNITSLNNSTPALNASYSYDARNRLTVASYSPSGVGRVNSFAYNYDDYGNMTQAKENSSTVFSQTYSNKNQIDSYTYDSRGNLTINPLYNYAWDNRNRLSQITNKLSGESEGAYAYDEKGMRLKAVRALVPELVLVAPNGGENWVLDTIQQITWNCKNIGANIRLELLENEIPVGIIIENLSPTTTSYAWTVGHFSTGTVDAGSGYSIRISAMDGSISDTADGAFILQQAQLAVTAPNGGENWQANTLHNISWTANFTGNVAIDLYKGGSFIANIGSALAETGTVAWTISTTLAAGTDYQIRIYQGTVEDFSENYFSISAAAAPTLAISFPNGGETLLAGATSHVTWTSANLSPDELLQVDYSLDNGVNWLAIGQTQNLGTISWTVPATSSTTCLARVSRVSTVSGPVNDASDNVFSITSQPLQITSPVGGENWLFKSYQNITWVATGITGNVRIRLFLNGKLVGPIVDIAASAGTYSWKVGAYDDPVAYAAAGSGYAIQIKSLDIVHISTSPGTFTIYKATGVLELTSPSGGENWQAGSDQTITWSGGKDIRELKLEYSTDLGSTYRVIVEHAPNTGSYSWHVPESVSGHCLMRISDAEGQAIGENTVMSCDLAFILKGKEMDTAAPLLSLWLKSPLFDGEAARNNFPIFTLGRSELIDGYRLGFGEYNADLADAASLFDNNHKINVQWDIMRSRGTVYFDDKPIFKDIPLMPIYDSHFAPLLTLRTGKGLSSLRLDDFRIDLLRQNEASSSYDNVKAADSGQSDEPANGYTLLLLDDFESYRSDEFFLLGGWSAFLKYGESGLTAGIKLSGPPEIKTGLFIDSNAPISGTRSGNITIPSDTILTLTKPISLPERTPFAVSQKPFAIIRAEETSASNEEDANIHHEKEEMSQVPDDRIDQNLRGPHVGIPVTSSPVIAKATLYGTTYYIHSFDGKLLAEYDSAGICQKDYIYMGNKLIAEYQPVTGAKYYYTSDQINSTRIITNSSGTVVYSALFDPYGGMQKQWVNTYSPSLKFSGKERESGSEMDYFGARYYDHQRYRFISVDPAINKDEALANPQLWNLYAYCRNNPITYLDPDGRWSKEVHDKIINTAFPGVKNAHMRNILKEASAYVDNTDQSISGSYKHAMRAPWQTKKEAEIQKNQFLTEMKSQYNILMSKGKMDEAYFALGMAMHTLMDSTSPKHEEFQIWGNMDMFNPTQNALGNVDFLIKGIPHLFENSISSSRMGKSVGLIQYYLKENQK